MPKEKSALSDLKKHMNTCTFVFIFGHSSIGNLALDARLSVWIGRPTYSEMVMVEERWD